MPGASQSLYLGSVPLEWSLTLESGDTVRIEVRQRGVDAAAIVFSPDGKQLLFVDNNFNQYGPEWIEFIANQNGRYVLRVELSYPDAPKGVVEVILLERLVAKAVRQAAAQRLVQEQAALKWLRNLAVQLGTPESEGSVGWADLARSLGRHRIVGLGEATHGSREFRLGANRLIHELMSKHDFRCLVIETHPQGAKGLDEFVNGGAGTAQKVVEGLRMWVWTTEEMATLVASLRIHATKSGHRIRVEGMDSFYTRAAANSARDILAALGTEPASQAAKEAGVWLDPPKPKTAFDPRPLLYKWLDVINGGLGEQALVARHAELRDARRWTRLALAGLDAQALDDAASGGLRDLAMAEAVSSLVESEPGCRKAIVLAHNNHIALKPYGAQVRDPMGAHLRRYWGDGYVSWGSAFSQGAFVATDPTKAEVAPFTVTPAPPDSLDGLLGRVGPDIFAIDLRALENTDPARDIFRTPQKMRTIGGGYVVSNDREAAFARPIPAETFDGLTWYRNVQTSRLIKK